MSNSKLSRFEKLYSKNPIGDSTTNKNKAAIVTEIASMPAAKPEEEVNREEAQEQAKQKEVASKRKPKGSSEKTTKNDKAKEAGKDDMQTVAEINSGTAGSSGPLTSIVTQSIQSLIQNKTTKEETHKRSTYMIKLETLAKLENYDAAHGGRVKGEFINNLLEKAFEEMEKDPYWKEVLNKDLDKRIRELSRKR